MPGRQHEQRKSARKPKRQAAWISNDAGGCPIPCVLWDLSEGGARLAPARANVVPDVFTLLLTRDGKSHRLCRVAWRKKPYIGVQFIEDIDGELDLHIGMAQRKVVSGGASPVEPALVPALLAGPAQSFTPSSGVRPANVAMSSLAITVIALLAVATVVFYAAGLQLEAGNEWAMEACSYARNFCEHPEFSGLPAAIMSVVYLSLRGMEL